VCPSPSSARLSSSLALPARPTVPARHGWPRVVLSAPPCARLALTRTSHGARPRRPTSCLLCSLAPAARRCSNSLVAVLLWFMLQLAVESSALLSTHGHCAELLPVVRDARVMDAMMSLRVFVSEPTQPQPRFAPRVAARRVLPSPHHRIRPATASSNCEAPSSCALASIVADSAIKFTSAPCSVRFTVGDFSTLQIRAARPACARSSSIGFRRVRVYRRAVKPIIPYSTPKQTPLFASCSPSTIGTTSSLSLVHISIDPASSRVCVIDLVVVPCIIKKSQESGEDEASNVKFVYVGDLFSNAMSQEQGNIKC
jgi:hypothetical protein